MGMKQKRFSQRMTPLKTSPTSLLAVGTDLVHVPDFAAQLRLPGSGLSKPGGVFTGREIRRAHDRAQLKGDDPSTHLAGVWAAKEAAVKAWVCALEQRALPLPFTVETMEWTQLTVSATPAGAPTLQTTGAADDALRDAFGSAAAWQVSISHDGDYALAFVVLTG